MDAGGLCPSEWDRVERAARPPRGRERRRPPRGRAPGEGALRDRVPAARPGHRRGGAERGHPDLARGTTEREAAAAYRAEVVKRGADPCRVLVSMGERTGLPLAWPTDRALRPGELVRFDVGCVYRGYHAGVARTAVLGDPTREHDARYGALLAGVEAAIAGAAPGTFGRPRSRRRRFRPCVPTVSRVTDRFCRPRDRPRALRVPVPHRGRPNGARGRRGAPDRRVLLRGRRRRLRGEGDGSGDDDRGPLAESIGARPGYPGLSCGTEEVW